MPTLEVTQPVTQPIDNTATTDTDAPLVERPRVRPNQLLWFLLDQTNELLATMQSCDERLAALDAGQRERNYMQSTLAWAILGGIVMLLILTGILVGATLLRGPVIML